MSERPHTLRAFLLAPLLVPLLWSFRLGALRAHGPLQMLGEVGVVTLSSLPFIYGGALLVGVPAYRLIRRRSQLRLWHTTLIGAGLGAVVLPIAEPVIDRTVGLGALLGLAAGTLFWVLWRPRPNRALNPTGLRPAG
jgi:hypothetical protein